MGRGPGFGGNLLGKGLGFVSAIALGPKAAAGMESVCLIPKAQQCSHPHTLVRCQEEQTESLLCAVLCCAGEWGWGRKGAIQYFGWSSYFLLHVVDRCRRTGANLLGAMAPALEREQVCLWKRGKHASEP